LSALLGTRFASTRSMWDIVAWRQHRSSLEHDLKEVDAGSWKRSCPDQQLRAR
jgi:hypothetical protein